MALFLIVPRLAGQKKALEYLRDATVAWLVVAVVVECVSLLFYSLLFRRLLRLLKWPATLPLSLGSPPPTSSRPAAWAAQP